MKLRLKPVYMVGEWWPLIPQPDGALELITDPKAVGPRIESYQGELKDRIGSEAEILDPAVIRVAADIAVLKETLAEADAVLLHILGLMPLGDLLEGDIPIMAFAGDRTPMMGLYALPIEEREAHPNLTFCLDYEEISQCARLLSVKKRLSNTRIAFIGDISGLGSHWEHLPDREVLQQKFGIDMAFVSAAKFAGEVARIDSTEADAVARRWVRDAVSAEEPSTDEIVQVARVYLAMRQVVERTDSQAVAVGCLELMYLQNLVPHCFALAALRDEGIPAACESDVSALVTMLILGYLSNKPAYMGNTVRADPEGNLLMISHGCTPAKMAGLDKPPMQYTLVHSYSGRFIEGTGLTSFVELDKGQMVTVGRIARNLDRLYVTTGEIIDCRDTLCDRTTVDLRVPDVCRFFHNAPGNHQVLVYGDHIEDLRNLCGLLGIDLLEA